MMEGKYYLEAAQWLVNVLQITNNKFNPVDSDTDAWQAAKGLANKFPNNNTDDEWIMDFSPNEKGHVRCTFRLTEQNLVGYASECTFRLAILGAVYDIMEKIDRFLNVDIKPKAIAQIESGELPEFFDKYLGKKICFHNTPESEAITVKQLFELMNNWEATNGN